MQKQNINLWKPSLDCEEDNLHIYPSGMLQSADSLNLLTSSVGRRGHSSVTWSMRNRREYMWGNINESYGIYRFNVASYHISIYFFSTSKDQTHSRYPRGFLPISCSVRWTFNWQSTTWHLCWLLHQTFLLHHSTFDSFLNRRSSSCLRMYSVMYLISDDWNVISFLTLSWTTHISLADITTGITVILSNFKSVCLGFRSLYL